MATSPMPLTRLFQNVLVIPAIGAPTEIDFHFDFASLYGYFMSEKIDALAARHGRTVTWRPMISFAVPRALALCGPLENAVKREYMLADVERSARFPGIACQFPSKFPITTPCAAAWHTAGPDAGDGQTVHQSTIYPGHGGTSATVGQARLENVSIASLQEKLVEFVRGLFAS